MLTEPTIDKLHALRLGAMAAAWTTQREDPKSQEIDFDSRFGMIVDAEHLARENKRVARALREGTDFRSSGRLVHVVCHRERFVNRFCTRWHK